MKKYTSILVLFFSLLFSINILAQKLNVAKLDSLFQVLETNDNFMGSIAVSNNGQLIYSKAIGYADIAASVKPTIATKYRIGSISKMFTAVLIFKAIEEKKLTLDKTIDSYFPTIINSQKITISNLLNHRSGIHNFTGNPDYLSWCTQTKSENELLDIIIKGKSDFEPGSKGKYSNTNYVLLSFILEKLYNKPYGELLYLEITKPLGLKNTYLGSKISISKHECYSYKYDNKWIKEIETDMSVPLGAGAVVSNPSDLTKFIEGLFSGKLISESSLKQMTLIQENFGMGIFQFPFYDKKLYGHTGGIDGFSSMLTIMPEDKISIAIISNGTIFNLNTIMLYALSCYYNKPFDIPTFKTIELKSEDLDQYLGVYSTKQLPLKLIITKNGNKLIAQGTGQPSFGLEASDKNIFKGLNGSIVLEFTPNTRQMILKQGGVVFMFTREGL